MLTNLVSLQRLFRAPVYFDSSLRTGDHTSALALGRESVQSERYFLLLLGHGALYQGARLANGIPEGEPGPLSFLSFPYTV